MRPDIQSLWMEARSGRLGRPFMVGPKVPPQRVAALRKSFMTMVRDPKFLAEAKKFKIDIDPLSGEDLQTLIAGLANHPNSVFERRRKLTKLRSHVNSD